MPSSTDWTAWPTYPKVSTVVGQAVQSVLLGKAEPQQALSNAANQVNGILSAPS